MVVDFPHVIEHVCFLIIFVSMYYLNKLPGHMNYGCVAVKIVT